MSDVSPEFSLPFVDIIIYKGSRGKEEIRLKKGSFYQKLFVLVPFLMVAIDRRKPITYSIPKCHLAPHPTQQHQHKISRWPFYQKYEQNMNKTKRLCKKTQTEPLKKGTKRTNKIKIFCFNWIKC